MRQLNAIRKGPQVSEHLRQCDGHNLAPTRPGMEPSINIERAVPYTSLAVSAGRAQYHPEASAELERERKMHMKGKAFGVLFIRGGDFLDAHGPVVVPRKIVVLVILSGAHIDLSEAIFVHPVTEIRVVSILGGVVVTLPPGVRLETTGLAILGSFAGTSKPPVTLDAPLLRMKGVAILGAAVGSTNETAPVISIAGSQVPVARAVGGMGQEDNVKGM